MCSFNGAFFTFFCKFHYKALWSGQQLSSHVPWEMNTISCQELFVLESHRPGKQILLRHHPCRQLFTPHTLLSCQTYNLQLEKELKKQHLSLLLLSFFFHLIFRTSKSLMIHSSFALSILSGFMPVSRTKSTCLMCFEKVSIHVTPSISPRDREDPASSALCLVTTLS